LREFLAERRVSEDGFIFTRQKEPDKPVAARYVNDNLKRIIEKAGIEPDGRKITVQSFRFTYITFIQPLLSADTVMKPVVHRNIRMTDYYNKRLIGGPLSKFAGMDTAPDNLLS
jgi:integrase